MRQHHQFTLVGKDVHQFTLEEKQTRSRPGRGRLNHKTISCGAAKTLSGLKRKSADSAQGAPFRKSFHSQGLVSEQAPKTHQAVNRKPPLYTWLVRRQKSRNKQLTHFSFLQFLQRRNCFEKLKGEKKTSHHKMVKLSALSPGRAREPGVLCPRLNR